MNKQNAANLYSGILLSYKKKESTAMSSISTKEMSFRYFQTFSWKNAPIAPIVFTSRSCFFRTSVRKRIEANDMAKLPKSLFCILFIILYHILQQISNIFFNFFYIFLIFQKNIYAPYCFPVFLTTLKSHLSSCFCFHIFTKTQKRGELLSSFLFMDFFADKNCETIRFTK